MAVSFTEGIFSGEGGIATYAFMYVLAVFSYLARALSERAAGNVGIRYGRQIGSASVRHGSESQIESANVGHGSEGQIESATRRTSVLDRRIVAGLVMMVVSRVAHLLATGSLAEWGGLFSSVIGMLGLYLIIVAYLGESKMGLGERVAGWTDGGADERTGGRFGGATAGEVNGKKYGAIDGSDGETYGRTDVETDGENERATGGKSDDATDGESDGSIDGATDGSVDGATDGSVDGSTDHADQDVKRIIQTTGALTGAVLGGILFSLLWSDMATNVLVAAGCSFSVFAPLGFLVGALWNREHLKGRRIFVFSASMSLMVLGTIMLGLSVVGINGGNPFWQRALLLCDAGGIFLLLIAPVADTANYAGAKVNSESPGEIGEGDNTGDGIVATGRLNYPLKIEKEILLAKDFKEIYRKLMEDSAGRAGVDFVILRTLKLGDEIFEIRAGHGMGSPGGVPISRYSVEDELFHKICSESERVGKGYIIDIEDLSNIKSDFIPSGSGNERGREGKVLIVPAEESGVTKVILAAGFFDAVPESDLIDIFEYYSTRVLQIYQNECLKRELTEKERILSFRSEELASVNRLKSNFLSIVSHELRTPLTTLMAYIETMLSNLESIKKETIEDFLNVMNEESERLIRLVDNILSYSNMETGHIKVGKTRCNLNELIEKAQNQLNDQFISDEINLELKMPKKPVAMDADRKLISQLIHNLLSNALKFTPRGGKIVVTLEEEASSARITVQDTGRGIPDGQLEKIFDRFHQADASDTREHGGSGLGLAICKNIVNWHDGKIWVENVKEAGAKFVVLLPIKDVVVRRISEEGFMGPMRFEQERYLTLLVEMLAEFLRARKASIMLLDEEQDILRIVAAKGIDAEFVQNTRLEVGERIAGAVAEGGEPLLVSNIEKDQGLRMANNSEFYGTKSFISVPMMEGEKVLGVLNVSDRVEDTEFTEVDMELMKSLAPIIMGMLKKLSAFRKVSSNFESLKDAMSSILDVREEWGAKKLSLLTVLAVSVGKRLNLDEHSLTALRLGMNMYDMGMMKVPRSIRAKKEKLSANEWEKLKQHTDIGYTLASPMGLEQKIMRIIRSHHEQFDGSGYPNGLKGYEIPLETRIINVVDSFRALVSEGPYRRCYSIDEAKNEIIKGAGKRFDPKVVSAFIKSLDELEDIEPICERGMIDSESEVSGDGEESDNSESKQQKDSIREGVT